MAKEKLDRKEHRRATMSKAMEPRRARLKALARDPRRRARGAFGEAQLKLGPVLPRNSSATRIRPIAAPLSARAARADYRKVRAVAHSAGGASWRPPGLIPGHG